MAAAVPSLLVGNPSSSAVYEALTQASDGMGSYTVEEKKTSFHVTAGKAAFLGIHPRKNGLRINLVLTRPLDGARVVKVERVSANRFHNEIDVHQPAEVDEVLIEWLREAYDR